MQGRTHVFLHNQIAVGIDWSTWSKPRCGKTFDELQKEVFGKFKTMGDKAWGGHGYKGHDLATYGNCCWRGDDMLVDLPGRAMEFIRYYLKMADKDVCKW